jgi:hypothetical protein
MRPYVLLLSVIAAGCGSPSVQFEPLDMTAPSMDASGRVNTWCDTEKNIGCMPGLRCAATNKGDTCVCDFVKQTGCAAGQRCVVTSSGDLCAPIPERTIPLGEKCAPIQMGDVVSDYCETGLVCANYGTRMQCRKPCFYRKECGADEACVATTGSTSVKEDPFFTEIFLKGCAKYDNCNPITQEGCSGDFRCLFTGFDDVGRVKLCRAPTGSLPPNNPCVTSSDCAPGVMCASLGICRKLCYLHPAQGETQGICPSGTGDICKFFYGSGDFGRCE